MLVPHLVYLCLGPVTACKSRHGIPEGLEVFFAPAQLGGVAPVLAHGVRALGLAIGEHAGVADVAPVGVGCCSSVFAQAGDVQTGAPRPDVYGWVGSVSVPKLCQCQH